MESSRRPRHLAPPCAGLLCDESSHAVYWSQQQLLLPLQPQLVLGGWFWPCSLAALLDEKRCCCYFDIIRQSQQIFGLSSSEVDTWIGIVLSTILNSFKLGSTTTCRYFKVGKQNIVLPLQNLYVYVMIAMSKKYSSHSFGTWTGSIQEGYK